MVTTNKAAAITSGRQQCVEQYEAAKTNKQTVKITKIPKTTTTKTKTRNTTTTKVKKEKGSR